MGKPTIRTSTSAVVSLTVEVRVGSWGPECKLSQVYDPGDVTFADRICLARKPAVCRDCAGPIYPREQQRRLEAKFDGQLRVYRWCVQCCRAMALSWEDDYAALEARWALRRQREEAVRKEAA